jgi:clan AA aspartic protease (TIGR02281 family)
MRGAFIVLCFVLPAVSASAATIFKCKDASGVLQYQEKPCTKETQPVSSWASKSGGVVEETVDGSSSGPYVIGQGRGGHYFIDGSVNDQFLNFVIDTGASMVTLPIGIATSAGIKCQERAAMKTGNGLSQVCTATIAKLTFGHFVIRNVSALLAPNLDQPLLGMNVLRQFRVEQDEGQMRLMKKY